MAKPKKVSSLKTKAQLDNKPEPLSKEMRGRIESMAQSTWNAIAYEVDSLLRQEGEKLTLTAAAEVTGDADYMLSYGRDPEAYQAFMAMSYDAQTRILRKALKGMT